MTAETTRSRLLDLMQIGALDREGVAQLLHVSPHTVHAWTKPATSKSSSPPPLMAVELLEFKLGIRSAA